MVPKMDKVYYTVANDEDHRRLLVLLTNPRSDVVMIGRGMMV